MKNSSKKFVFLVSTDFRSIKIDSTVFTREIGDIMKITGTSYRVVFFGSHSECSDVWNDSVRKINSIRKATRKDPSYDQFRKIFNMD